MADATPSQLAVRRWGQLKAERATWIAHWREISNYLLPRSGRYFTQDRDRGMRRHNNIMDNTGTRALDVLAAGMMAGMTSPARPWFRLTTPDPDMDKFGPVKEWLHACTRIMQDVFEKSNTYRSLHTIYRELGAFGTAAAIVSDDFDNVIHHSPLTVGEFAIATDWQGNVCTLYREFQKTVGEIVKEFGYEACSNTIKRMFDAGQLDAWVTIIHAIEPRTDRDPGLKDSKNMAWSSIYFELGQSPDKVLRESGFKSFPALCPRWDVIGGDIYGNSPGMLALGDVKQLQHEQLRKANAIDAKTNPALQVPTSLKNRDVDRLPGGITFVDQTGPGTAIQPLFDARTLDLTHLLQDIQDVRSRVNGAFYSDMFLMISGNPNDPRMTATEVAERHEEKMLMLGPVVERLNNEMLDPLITMTFQRMVRAGVIPRPPPEMHGVQLNIEFVSMLAQAQRAIGVNGTDRFVNSLGQVAQIKPEVLDKFNADKWAEAYADNLGLDPSMIVADKDVAIIRQNRAQAQAQQAKLQQAEQAASAAQKLGQVPTQGGSSNAASDLMSQFSGYN